jgi:hypothetical protein
MFMSWHRLTADKKESRDYDTWLNSVENFDVLETSAANPTEATA